MVLGSFTTLRPRFWLVTPPTTNGSLKPYFESCGAETRNREAGSMDSSFFRLKRIDTLPRRRSMMVPVSRLRISMYQSRSAAPDEASSTSTDDVTSACAISAAKFARSSW